MFYKFITKVRKLFLYEILWLLYGDAWCASQIFNQKNNPIWLKSQNKIFDIKNFVL